MKIFRGASKYLILSVLLFSNSAFSLAIWTDWTSASTGLAFGTLGAVNVTYTGEVDGAIVNGSSTIWNPSTTYVGGVSDVSPDVVGDDIRLDGTNPGTNTINFSSTVVNPLFAIWSLGQPSIEASFTFDALPTFVVGGPNSSFGGSSIMVAGNTVSGMEGNGVVQFLGSFDSISFTSTIENFYAFTVGLSGDIAPPPPPPNEVPEPAPLALLGLGLAGLGWMRYKQS